MPRALLCLVLASSIAGCATTPPPGPSTTIAPAAAQTGAAARAGDAIPGAEERLMLGAGVDPSAIRCSRETRWGTDLNGDARQGAADIMRAIGPGLRDLSAEERDKLQRDLEKVVFWRLVRALLIEGDNNNFGVVALRGRTWRDATGHERPVLIFRSGLTPRPEAGDSCFRSMLEAGAVRHVVNIFDGGLPSEDLVAAESATAAAAGATYRRTADGDYGPWRDLLRGRANEPGARTTAARAVARLIREQILLPDGAPPRGNIHVHCGGGMHRTGMIVGVIERCVNGAPMDVIEASYKAHAGWRSADQPGGYEEDNLRFVREFDCRLLDPDAGSGPAPR